MKQTIRILTILLISFLSTAAVTADPVGAPQKEVFKGHQLIDDWNIREAESFTNILIKKYPESGDAYFLKARVEFLKGNYEYAVKILTKVEGDHTEVTKFKQLAYDTHKTTKSFITKESNHFIYRFQPGPDEILIHYATEVLEKSYMILGNLFDYYPNEKVLVEFYPNRNPFSKVSPLTLNDINTSGTVALCKYNRIMIISPGSLVRGYNWMDTLSHEYGHYILTKKSRNKLPLWIHEGIAKYFEARWRNKDTYLTPVMEAILAKGLQDNYLIPLDRMMPSLAKLGSAEDVQLAYAEVSSMVEYLTKIQGEKVFSYLLKNLADGESFDQTLTDKIGKSLSTFQNEWKQFVKEKKFKTIPGLKSPGIKFKTNRSSQEPEKEYREINNRKSQDLVFLGDILKDRSHHKAAIIEYQRAIDQSKIFSPIVYNKLAKTHFLTKEYNKAKMLLEKSLRHYPMFHTTLASMGELYFNIGNIEKSLYFYEKAIRMNPFNPFVHMQLMAIHQKLQSIEKQKLQKELLGFID